MTSQNIQTISDKVVERLRFNFKPKPKMTVTEWAEKKRILSSETASRPGPWETLPYQKAIMDAWTNPEIETIVIMASAQCGKTEIILNCIGYVIDMNPGPMLVALPTEQLAEDFSVERLEPMIQDCEDLKNKIPKKGKDGSNTIKRKKYPGGTLSLVGATSPKNLRMRPVRYVLLDEVDAMTVTKEGDPVELAFKRTLKFFDRKKILCSTPTLENFSRIAREYDQSDKNKWHVRCVHCNEQQIPDWKNVKWDKEVFKKEELADEKIIELKRDGINFIRSHKNAKKIYYPDTAEYMCPECRCLINDRQFNKMYEEGEWIPENRLNKIAGFHINEFFNPDTTLGEMAGRFLIDKRSPDTLQVFINTVLGETYNPERGEAFGEHVLFNRREAYAAEVPKGVGILTAGVDVQKDRLECTVVGWGVGKEAWVITHEVFNGEPAEDGVWLNLEGLLHKSYKHESGNTLKISAMAVDIGGHYSAKVYDFAKKTKRAYAIQGWSGFHRPFVGNPTRNNKQRVPLFGLGVDSIKEMIRANLKIDEPDYGYVHFPMALEMQYFKQLTAETLVQEYKAGIPVRKWVKKPWQANEALDCFVYSIGALGIVNPPNLERLVEKANRKKEKKKKEENKMGKNWVTNI